MPRWNIDNLMTHVAAAALIVDDHEVDVNDLREDLKIENKEYVVSTKHSSHQQLTSPQDQAVLLRARLQSQPPNTDRHDQVQIDQGRGREPQHRKAAHPAVVPEGERPDEEEEINGESDNHHNPKHRSSTELHGFILHFTSVSLAMWSSGTIGVGLDRPRHLCTPSSAHHHPTPHTQHDPISPRPANLDLQISARCVYVYTSSKSSTRHAKMPISHGD